MRNDPTVTDLVIRARNGDSQAWDALVERYAPLVWSICRRYRLGSADAEDVNQSVWLALVDQLAALREPAALPGWLATTTRRECGRVLRTARGPQMAWYAPDAEDIPDEQAVTAEEELLQAERQAALREAFTYLPPSCQRLIGMLYPRPSRAVCQDQRGAGHPDWQHRAQPPPVPGQAPPSSGSRCPHRRRNWQHARLRPQSPAGGGFGLGAAAEQQAIMTAASRPAATERTHVRLAVH